MKKLLIITCAMCILAGTANAGEKVNEGIKNNNQKPQIKTT